MGKGADTRDRILDQAVRLASRDGLEGLTIGTLSTELGLSKSGLFAHFGSKDELQLQVLQAAVERFEQTVIRAVFENWLVWEDHPSMPGGCLLIAASVEFDDRPGPQRDFLQQAHQRRFDFIAKGARMAVEAGHFRGDLDAGQFSFDVTAIVLGYHHTHRMLRDARAGERARVAFEWLLADSRT
jgi:AcrR family transcriptional regulator